MHRNQYQTSKNLSGSHRLGLFGENDGGFDNFCMLVLFCSILPVSRVTLNIGIGKSQVYLDCTFIYVGDMYSQNKPPVAARV